MLGGHVDKSEEGNMNQITSEVIDIHHEQLWGEAEKKYKNLFAVPKEEVTRINEILRGMYVVQIWQRDGGSGSPISALRSYSVSEESAQYVLDNLGYSSLKYSSKREKEEAPQKRANKWENFDKWAQGHRGEQFTTEQLVEQSGFSYQTTLKYVSESPIFGKVKRGLWSVSKDERD